MVTIKDEEMITLCKEVAVQISWSGAEAQGIGGGAPRLGRRAEGGHSRPTWTRSFLGQRFAAFLTPLWSSHVVSPLLISSLPAKPKIQGLLP